MKKFSDHFKMPEQFVKLGDKIVAIPMISKEQQKQEATEQKDFEMNADTSGLAVAGHIGTWHIIDQHEVGGHSFYLMEHDTYGDEAACIIVDERGKLVLDDVYNGFDDDTLRLLDLEVKEVPEMPDHALTVQDTGHRPQHLPFGMNENDDRCVKLKEALKEQIINLIEAEDVTHFITGMALGVDLYAAEIALDLKARYPNITLESSIPCETQAVKWSMAQRERYYDIAAQCDKETMLQSHYSPDCMDKRNRYMVDHADFIIAVWDGRSSGTGKTVQYAQRQGKPVTIINPKTMPVD